MLKHLSGLANLRAVLILTTFSQLVSAHEFWLEPTQYVAPIGSTVGVDIRVGQMYQGRAYPYIEKQTNTFFWQDAEGQHEPGSITGDKPAAKLKIEKPGYSMLAYESDAFNIRFTDEELLLNYLNTEGLEWVVDWYRDNNKDLSEVTETYYRHAKALVAGEGATDAPWLSEPLGLRIEIVPKSGFTRCGSDAFFQVLIDGEPKESLLVRRFEKGVTRVDEARTDAQGWVRFEPAPGPFLINTVHIDAGADNARALDRDWVSDWSSLTYACN